ncbi:MAG: aspartate 1-decarboxylase [Desulfonatronovibrionaceae bacterium]
MKLRKFLQAKIHRAVLTGTDVDYEGSIAICPLLLKASGIMPFEQVDVYNVDNGERLTTYAMSGEEGQVLLNGAAAHKGRVGQKVIIASYTALGWEEIMSHSPVLVFVDGTNKVQEVTHG